LSSRIHPFIFDGLQIPESASTYKFYSRFLPSGMPSIMTLDKSLQIRRGSVKAKSVLSRADRITKLKEAERWDESKSVLGLPKVRVFKLTMKKKKKKKEEEGAEGAAATPAAAPAAGKGAAAPAAKAAAPAKGGKK
jgi:small basic protein (TIGR04137 family)